MDVSFDRWAVETMCFRRPLADEGKCNPQTEQISLVVGTLGATMTSPSSSRIMTSVGDIVGDMGSVIDGVVMER